MKTKTSVAIVSALLLATTVTAFASKSNDSETSVTADAKISLTQAIATAEQHANGKAIKADLESDKKGAVYEIEVMSGVKTVDVQVDAQSGVGLASAEDHADRDGDDEHDHDKK